MPALLFYLDENVPVAVGRQLALYDIGAVSARDLMRLGDEDSSHLRRASRLGRVLCTHDQDFLRLASSGVEHAGIVFMPQLRASIGGWVRDLRVLHASLNPSEIAGRVFFLPLR